MNGARVHTRGQQHTNSSRREQACSAHTALVVQTHLTSVKPSGIAHESAPPNSAREFMLMCLLACFFLSFFLFVSNLFN